MCHVTARVLKGTGLAAKYVSGFFKKTYSSDPYFVITFKDKRYTSKPRLQTLEPEWNSPPFELGWINDAETKALRVQIFDCGAVGADNFMGRIRIPGRALHSLGLGDHIFWFKLGTPKGRANRHLAVSGRVLLHFRIDGRRHDSALCRCRCIHMKNKSIQTEPHSAECMQSERPVGAPLDSGVHARVDIKNNVSAALCSCLCRVEWRSVGGKNFAGLGCSSSRTSTCNLFRSRKLFLCPVH